MPKPKLIISTVEEGTGNIEPFYIHLHFIHTVLADSFSIGFIRRTIFKNLQLKF
jgi:hypothetical protein